MADTPRPFYVHGITSFEMGDINATTKLGENYADVGKIHRDRVQVNQEDAEITKHFAERGKFPVAVSVQDGGENIEASMMDVSADNLVQYLGGTASNVADAKDFWSAPDDHVVVEKAVKITTKDGTIFEWPRTRVIGTRKLTPTSKGTFSLDVMFVVLDPELDSVASCTITDAAITNVS